MSRKILSILALVVPLTILYLVYTGAIDYFEAFLGIIVSIIVGLLFADIVIKNPGKLYNPIRWIHGLLYTFLYFTIIEAKAHLQVISLIINPSRLKPAIVRIPYNVKTDYAVTAVANSITNTPGTVVIDIDESRKVMYVHWIRAIKLSDEEARKMVSELFEKYAHKIFD